MDFGRRVAGCAYCMHANREEFKCYPESGDCAESYDLEKADFEEECNCDFFEEGVRDSNKN